MTDGADAHPRAGDDASGAPAPAPRRAAERLRQAAKRAAGPQAYAVARSLFHLPRGSELRSPHSLLDKLDAWRRGFKADSVAIYDFERNDPRDYLNDYVRQFRCVRINPARALFDHKLAMRVFLLSKGLPQAETVALLHGGDVQLAPFSDAPRLLTPAELEAWMLRDGGRYIVKPEDGTRGANVVLVTTDGGVLRRHRGREARPYRVAASPHVVTLVERVIEQGEFWRTLCPHSTNTMRVVTMWAPGERAPFIGAALQRIGTADTAPADNWSAGGIGARIDVATGRMGRGRMHPRKGRGTQLEFTHHPDTGAQIEGAAVPHWDRVCETVLRAASSSLAHRYVGWDVAVDAEGVPVIIEGNNNTDVNLLQVHGGLLADPRIRRFYEQCGVL